MVPRICRTRGISGRRSSIRLLRALGVMTVVAAGTRQAGCASINKASRARSRPVTACSRVTVEQYGAWPSWGLIADVSSAVAA